MAVDLNQADEQGSGAEPIPEDSIVIVTAEIRPPKAGKEGTVHPLFCAAPSGYEYLDFEFTTVSGRKIWQNCMLHYTKGQTEKSDMAISISMRFLRAVVEAARKISPKDTSSEATKQRIINDFSDINGMMFPVVVGVEWGRPGDLGKRYLNNTIKRVVTPGDKRYEEIFKTEGGEILSGKPLPPEPEAAAAAAGSKPTWAAPAQTTPPPQASLPGTKSTKPAWLK